MSKVIDLDQREQFRVLLHPVRLELIGELSALLQKRDGCS